MLFSLEALQAKRGDALLIHVGDPADPTLLVVDGGWRGVYRKTLKPRLEALRAARAPDDALPIRLLMVSHIDSDHIQGVLDLTGELDAAREANENPRYVIEDLWHNSFDDVVGEHAADLENLGVAAVGPASLIGEITTDLPNLGRPAALMLASVPQGRQLRLFAQAAGLAVNRPSGGLVANRGDGAPIDPPWVDGLETVVVGPSQARLEALQKAWDKDLRARGLAEEPEAVDVVAYLDRSVFNLASLVVLLRADGREMLLTGDARGDDILAGLEEADLLDAEGRRHVDLLKLPHHGSVRNVEEDFFRRVTADHYVVSGDGIHGNPDLEMFRLLFSARAADDRPFSLYLTYALADLRPHHGHPYPVDELEALFAEHRTSGKLAAVHVPNDGELGVRIDLGEPYVGA